MIEKVLAGFDSYDSYTKDPIGFCETEFGESYTDDVKAMMLSVRDNPITIAQSANAVGKTHSAARIAIWFYKCHKDVQVYTAAAPPEDNLIRLLWGEIGNIVAKHPKLFQKESIKSLHISAGPLDFITGVTIPLSGTSAQRKAKFSGKHRPHLLFILDEGDAIPDEIYEAIEGCMSGGTMVRLLVMFNPRSETGEAYRMIRDRQANVVHLSAVNHPNVVTGENVIPGAVDRQTTVRRINQWCRLLADNEPVSDECFQLPDFLVGAESMDQRAKPFPPLKSGYYKITNPAFSYMVLGQYPAQGSNQLISKEWTAAARSRWDLYVSKFGEVPPHEVVGIMGVDPGEFGDDMTQCAFRYGGWVDKFIGWGGVDMMTTGDRASEQYHKRPLYTCAVDANGVGAGVAPHMRRLRCNAHGVKVQERATETTEQGEFGILRDQLWWACREWLRVDSGSMIPPDEELLEELHTTTYEIKNGRIKIMDKDTMREHLKRSPNKADALCMTFDISAQEKTTPFVYKPMKKVAYAW